MSYLEKLEMVCLDYLANSSDPWTPFSKLYEFCKDTFGEEFPKEKLFDFLSHHPEIKVFTIMPCDNPEFETYLRSKDIKLEPFVILRSRMPNEIDMLKWILRHIDGLTKLLEKQLCLESYKDRKTEIEKIINKANSLKRKISFYLSKKVKATDVTDSK